MGGRQDEEEEEEEEGNKAEEEEEAGAEIKKTIADWKSTPSGYLRQINEEACGYLRTTDMRSGTSTKRLKESTHKNKQIYTHKWVNK